MTTGDPRPDALRSAPRLARWPGALTLMAGLLSIPLSLPISPWAYDYLVRPVVGISAVVGGILIEKRHQAWHGRPSLLARAGIALGAVGIILYATIIGSMLFWPWRNG